MKHFFKVFGITTGLVLAGILVIGGTYLYGAHQEEQNTIKAEVDEENSTDQHIELIEEEADMATEIPVDTSERQIRQIIHEMSHQKIKAAEKWGAIPLTEERVSRLLFVVKMNKDNYEDDHVYMKILESWKAKDFSKADIQHNTIWRMQNGTKGKATGLMSIEEEKQFIIDRFND